MTMILLILLGIGSLQDRSESAKSIVKTMAIQYLTAKSYQDSGSVETTYVRPGAMHVERMPFKTYFMRPQLFRFEWWHTPLHSLMARKDAIVCNNNRTVIYWDGQNVEVKEDLSLGIAATVGVSSGASHTISSLLIENISEFQMTDLAELVLKRSDVFDRNECFVITGTHPLGDTYELWVGKRDYLLHKLRTEHKFDTFSTITVEVRRDIKLNASIPLDIFQLKPGD